jgi:ATP-dependent helicase/nuclease subunit A
MSTTGAQQQAIHAAGNVLVAAGAGAGKTSTLVARCARIIEEGGSLENILMVTFTEAAAAEMRTRIRKALEESGKQKAESGKRRAALPGQSRASRSRSSSGCRSAWGWG